jgi:DNA-binding transcriptional regulator YhcF (GntR family)
VYAGTDPLTGRALRFRQTVKTEMQARVVLGRRLGQAAEGRRPDMDVTVADVLARYMAVAELDPSTRNTYTGYIRRTILPALGSMELRKVRGPLLDTFYARLRRCGDLTCTGRPFIEHRSFPGLTIEPGSSRSAWPQAVAAIREAVSSGQLAPGEQLPSVRELAAQHGLPVAALRRALEELAREGLIAVRHGRRAIVSGGPSQAPMPHPLAERFTLARVARKVVGVGSVGTETWILLMEPDDGLEPLLLQAKQAQRSVLAGYAGQSEYHNQGERVVTGQHLMQAVSDIFLGWQRAPLPGRGSAGYYYLRQLRDWKYSANPRQGLTVAQTLTPARCRRPTTPTPARRSGVATFSETAPSAS